MLFSPPSSLFMETLDVSVELLPIDSPDAPAADLDGGELPGAHDRIDLRNADVQEHRHILEREKPRPDARRGLIALRDFVRIGHAWTLTTLTANFIGLSPFTVV